MIHIIAAVCAAGHPEGNARSGLLKESNKYDGQFSKSIPLANIEHQLMLRNVCSAASGAQQARRLIEIERKSKNIVEREK